jgi:hypothetical protein
MTAKVKEMAYAIWEGQGRPEGKDVENYFRAQQVLDEEQSFSLIESKESPQASKFPQRPHAPKLPPPPAEDVPPGQYKRRRYNFR